MAWNVFYHAQLKHIRFNRLMSVKRVFLLAKLVAHRRNVHLVLTDIIYNQVPA
jgi:hypothetical protein